MKRRWWNEWGDRASDSFKKLILFANRTYTLLLMWRILSRSFFNNTNERILYEQIDLKPFEENVWLEIY